jgi:ferredoxin, 2Fe-2S
MPKIKFIKNRPELTVPRGSNLMKVLLENGLPVASSCDGDGVCSKCRLKILTGNENLSTPNETELILKEQNNIGKEYRISCQTEVHGDITVDAGYW